MSKGVCALRTSFTQKWLRRIGGRRDAAGWIAGAELQYQLDPNTLLCISLFWKSNTEKIVYVTGLEHMPLLQPLSISRLKIYRRLSNAHSSMRIDKVVTGARQYRVRHFEVLIKSFPECRSDVE